MRKVFLRTLFVCLSVPATLWAQQLSPQRRKNQILVYKTVDTMRGLIVALAQYGQDHNDKLPPIKSLANLKAAFPPRYMAKNSFASPVTGLPFVLNKSVSFSGKTLRSVSSNTVLFYDAKPLSSYNDPRQLVRIVGYKDHIVVMPEKQWQNTKKLLHIP